LIPTSENGYGWKTADTFYHLYFKAHSNWGDGLYFSVTYNNTEYAFIYQPQDYSFRDKYGSQDYLSSIADVVGTVQNETITYTNAFQNIALRYTAHPDMVKEEYIIYQMPTKTPATYLTPPITLDYGGYVKYGQAKVYVNGTEMTGDFTTSSKIEFGTAPDNILFYIPEPYAIDANGQTVTCQYQVKKQGNQIWFYIRIPYTWLSAQERTFPVTVDPTVVGTSTSNYATFYPFQRKSFYANGRFWVFYSDGTNMVYCTSTDGSTWSSATTVRAAVVGSFFSIWFDGTYLHYAYACSSSIYYRRGTPNSDGSITWSTDTEQTVSTTYNQADYLMVSVDSSGYVWIGYRDYTGTYYYPYVIKSGNNDGTWGTGTITQLSTTSNTYWKVSVVPLTSGKMLALYTYNALTVRAKRWTGSAWGTEVATTSAIIYGYYRSAVAQGDDVHLTFLKSTGYDILYVKYTYSSNSFGSETTLQATATSTSAPVLSIDTATNDLYVFAATKTTGTPSGWTANHIYYVKYTASSGTWGSWTDWIDESTEVLTYADRLTCFYKDYGSKIGLEYSTKTASPYNVKFAYLTVAVGDTTPPIYSNVGTNTTVAGQPCKFSVKWTDNAGLSKWRFGTNNTGSWVNETWQSFSGNPAWSNITKTLNSTVGVRVEWQIWANDTSNNWNTTGIQYLITTQITVYERFANQTLSIHPVPSRETSYTRVASQPLQVLLAATRQTSYNRLFSQLLSCVATATRQLTAIRTSEQQLSILIETSRQTSYTRLTQQPLSILIEAFRKITLPRTALQPLQILTETTRRTTYHRIFNQPLSILLQATRQTSYSRLLSQPLSILTETFRQATFPRTALQPLQVLLSVSRQAHYHRTASILLQINAQSSPLKFIRYIIITPPPPPPLPPALIYRWDLTVFAKDQWQYPIEGATVSIYRAGTLVISGTTDEYGRFLAKDLSQGIYEVVTSYKNVTQKQTVTLTTDMMVIHEYGLLPTQLILAFFMRNLWYILILIIATAIVYIVPHKRKGAIIIFASGFTSIIIHYVLIAPL
jgi:hypothetical protein